MRNEYRLRLDNGAVTHLARPAYALGAMYRAGEDLTAFCGVVAPPDRVPYAQVPMCKRCRKLAEVRR